MRLTTASIAKLARGLLPAVMVLLLGAGMNAAQAADDFLPPERVFHHSERIVGDQVVVTWRVLPGHYLYKQRMSFETSSPGVTLATPQWPQGESHKDEFFGDQEVYRGTADFPIAFKVAGERPRSLDLKLKFQGCADAGLCYPPTTWTAKVDLPSAAAAAATGSAGLLLSRAAPENSAGGLQSPVPGSQNAEDFLPPDDAFRFVATMKRPDTVELSWAIADTYYLYKHRISVATDSDTVQLGAPLLPQGKAHTDEFFGDSEVYYEALEGTVPVARAAGSGGTLNLKVTYQGCADAGLCYLPITKTVALELPPTDTGSSLPNVDGLAAPIGAGAGGVPVSEQDKLASLVRDGNLPLMLATFFGLGILLSLTPCVLPMIPILSGIIAGQGSNITPARSFSLAFTYVQGMALTYAAAGAAFALIFKTAPQATFQQPWILILFAVLFVAMALAMFGTYTLQMPSAFQSRLTDVSNRQKSGTYVGTFVMGALSSLIVTACVAPVIVAALSVIAQTGNLARGAGALYATGLGMGVPLLLVGASAGSLLPRVGPWMDTIKSLFGVMFLAVAIYVIAPLLPDALTMLLWSALAVISGFWVFSLKARDGGPAAAPLRAAGLLALFYGVILLIGAASGGKDPLQPLGTLLAGNASGSPAAGRLELKRIKSVEDLDRELAAAASAGRPVMLDFYADWCVSCKEMEKYTFTDDGVQSTLANGVLLQADVTANDDLDQVLLKRFGIFGPPTIAFFGADGVERQNYRLVGFVPAARFRDHVAAAFAPNS